VVAVLEAAAHLLRPVKSGRKPAKTKVVKVKAGRQPGKMAEAS
jgi:hypothetical protein